MTDEFDPAKHKHGMAYRNSSNDGPLYPSGYTHEGRVYFQNNCQIRDCPFDRLIRSPPDDLLPRADVKPLVDALKKIGRGRLDSSGEWEWELQDYVNAPPNEVATDALAAFNSKHGE